MASLGHEVLGVDIDAVKVDLLNSGKGWFHEPDLDPLLADNLAAGRLRFTTDLADAGEFANVHFVGVATPGHEDGAYDLSQLFAAVSSLVPDRIEIVWNPEFLKEGYAVEDTLRPDRIVAGAAAAVTGRGLLGGTAGRIASAAAGALKAST